MGAEPWSYFVPYRADIESALFDLQEREFAAGRFRMPDTENPPSSIDEARRRGGASGTGTILDMIGVADAFGGYDSDDPSIAHVAPLSREQLVRLYGTERPSRAMVERNRDLYEWLDRGLGVYVIVYDGDAPSELFFAGYSFD